MDRFVIGTAGHVDHGKTTLVHALTGTFTDRLAEERRRGITIELGFARWKVADDVDASVIDMPGHRRLVHTMIAGASGIDLALLVVAADEAVMPQTREHVAVCELLGIRDAVVALTKTDRVDAETVALAEDDVRALLGDRWSYAVVPCAVAGELRRGLSELRDATADALRGLGARRAELRERGAKLWVDRVFSVKGAGAVATGTLVAGSIARGDVLAIVGPRGVREASVRELHVHGETTARATAPTRVALNLSCSVHDLGRGDLAVAPNDVPAPTERIDVSFRGRAPRRGATAVLHVGTTHVTADVVRAEDRGDEHLLRLALREPRPVSGGDRFVLRGSAVTARAGALLGGGVVLDARPRPNGRPRERRRLADALGARSAPDVLAVLLDERSPRALDLGDVRARLAIDEALLRAAVDRAVSRGDLVRCGTAAVAREVVARLAAEARALVATHSDEHPLDRGMPLATLRQRLAARAGEDVADVAIQAARAPRGAHDVEAIAIEDDVAVLAVRAGRVGAELARAMTRAREAIEAAGIHGVSLGHLIELTGWTGDFARAALAAVERSGDVARAGDLWFSRSVVEAVRARTLEHFRHADRLTVVELKALCGLPRRQAILLLEHFDAAGLTRREGDVRVRGAR